MNLASAGLTIPARFQNTALMMDPRAWPKLAEAARALSGEAPATRERVGYDLVGGIAVIEVSGVLIQRLYSLRSWGFVTGYDGIRNALAAALEDDQVKAIVFLVNSPGGECSGLFDLADVIFAARGAKPLWAICDDHAYSAAYCIASACDRVTVPATGGTGSIGVISCLWDMSAALEKMGWAPNFVTFGKRKAAESRAAYTGVTQEVLDGIQADVDRLGEMFVATVARNRGLTPKAVRAQEAACFQGELGVEAGLADQVASADAAFLELLASLD